jgi:general secretion pathway protein L
MLLEREVVLPLAAERDPRQVLHYEMDRLTPFNAEDVYWTWGIERRDRALGRLHLRLSLIPKALLREPIGALARAGIQPSAIEAGRRIALGGPLPRSEKWRRAALKAGAIACVLLGATAAVQPFVRQTLALGRIDARIAELRPRVAQAEALRRRIASAQASDAVLLNERARVGDALQALAVTTDLVPDDTYLTDFTMHERKITISGQSAAPAKLIAALSAGAAIRNPAFAAPVTRLGSGQSELFSIHADFVP